jgi:hypothetical protein
MMEWKGGWLVRYGGVALIAAAIGAGAMYLLG